MGAESLFWVQGIRVDLFTFCRSTRTHVSADGIQPIWVEVYDHSWQVSCDSDPSCQKLGWSWLVCIQQAESCLSLFERAATFIGSKRSFCFLDFPLRLFWVWGMPMIACTGTSSETRAFWNRKTQRPDVHLVQLGFQVIWRGICKVLQCQVARNTLGQYKDPHTPPVHQWSVWGWTTKLSAWGTDRFQLD